MTLCLLLYLCLAALNLFGASIGVLDKKRAQTPEGRRRRIAHKTLRALSLIGGGTGLLVGLRLSRHKTRQHGLRAGLAALGLLGLAAWALLLWALGCLPF